MMSLLICAAIVAIADGQTESRLAVGDEAVAIGLLDSDVYAATDETVWTEWNRRVGATTGKSEENTADDFRKEMIAAGRVFKITAGTKVVIERAFDGGDSWGYAEAEVRVIEGEMRGKTLFLSSAALRPKGTRPLPKFQPKHGYMPRVGDRVVVFSWFKESGVPHRTVEVCDGSYSYREFWKSVDIGDSEGERSLA